MTQTFLDQILGPIAKTVIADIGLCPTAVLKRQSTGYEPRTGTKVVSSTDQWTIHCTPLQNYNVRENGNIIQIGFRTTVSAVELTTLRAPVPTIDMKLVWGDGRSFRIIAVDSVFSGTLVVTYTLTLAA